METIPFTEIPHDYFRTPRHESRAAHARLRIDEGAWMGLERLAERISCARQAILLAAFKLQLYRLTAHDEVLIGFHAPSARGETEDLFLPPPASVSIRRTQFTAAQRFRDLLAQVSLEDQDAAFTRDSAPAADINAGYFIPVLFATFVDGGANSARGAVSNPTLAASGVTFEVLLAIQRQGRGAEIRLTYDAALFAPRRMTEFIAQYGFLLQQIAADPDLSCNDYSLVTEKARQILPDPSRSFIAEQEHPITEMFTSRARKNPEATAIVDRQHRWTFAQLEARSNALSHYLIASGTGVGDVVAVFVRRNAAFVVALLGILKAGAAFTILDPAYPVNRLRTQLRQSQPALFLHLDSAGDLPPVLDAYLQQNEIRYLRLPNTPTAVSGDPIGGYATAPPELAISPSNLAYIAFTSGSTGDPKGILGAHNPLSHFITWHRTTFGFSAADRFSMLSGLAHDPVLRDVFTPLCAGATLHIPAQDKLLDPVELFSWLHDNEITITHLTPSLSQIIAAGSAEAGQILPKLRYVFFGGEALTRRVVKDVRAIAPNATCVNFYGATETPQAMAFHEVRGTEGGTRRRHIPIGRGISGVQLLIFNKNNRLVGVGEPGEIHVRTPYLSLGYLGNSALTAEKFPRNPFTDEDGDRLYRTGDLGRYRADGLVEYAGRADRQSKIRGFRVEIGEIEAVLARHPHVVDCHVVVREDARENKQLVAFYRSSAPIHRTDLRGHVAAFLPSYMIPAVFMALEEYPHTPNGKIDHRALLSLLSTLRSEQEAYVAPLSATEKQLTVLWQELFERKLVGIEDDFFDLGGDSLLAVQMFVGIRNRFGLELHLSELFQNATIAAIGRVIDTHRGEQAPPSFQPPASLIAAHQAQNSDMPAVYFVHGNGGNILFMREWQKHLARHRLPLYGFQARGVDGISRPHDSVEDMARDYIAEMRVQQPTGPYFIGGYSGGGSVALEMAAILRRQGEEVPLVLLLDSYHPDVHNRHYSSEEHLRNALRNPFTFVRDRARNVKGRLLTALHRRRIKRYLALNQPIPLELRDLHLYEHISALRQKYVTKAYDGPVVLLKAAEIWAIYDHVAEDLGWRRTLSNLTIRTIPGDHDLLIREPNVGLLISEIATALRQAHANS